MQIIFRIFYDMKNHTDYIPKIVHICYILCDIKNHVDYILVIMPILCRSLISPFFLFSCVHSHNSSLDSLYPFSINCTLLYHQEFIENQTQK